ncbi:MAG: TauD/TfdA family dioxygenase [Actinomycetota bacterium]|nr:TauD/TfdA family dioxygenase [Actinomycetota bacterium]
MSENPIEVRPLAGTIGAEIRGVDVSRPVDAPLARKIKDLLVDHAVLVLRDQAIDRAQHLAFARTLGEPDRHPIAQGMDEMPEMIRVHKPAGEAAFFGTSWHTDNTFFERPSAITVLHGVTIPPYGGDTLYASMERAWQGLSKPMQAFLQPLKARHSARPAFDPSVVGQAKYDGAASIKYEMSDAVYAEVLHPVARTHPDTGRISLFVNPMFTLGIEGLEKHESDALLEMLYAHATRPEYTCRVRWEPNTLVLWDNRQTQHYAVDDYANHERLMYRVTLKGERPA